MNLNNIRKEPAFAAAAGGFLGLLLRSLLYRIGFDDRGMLSAFHPLQTATVILTLFMGVYLALTVRKSPENTQAHPSLRLAAGFLAGCFLLFRTAATFRQMTGPLGACCVLLNILAAASMFLLPMAGNRRFPALCHGLVCAAYAADILNRYRDWSGNPQLPDYVLQIFACLLLSLCSYHLLAFDAGLGKRRFLLWCSLMAMYLSLACVSGPDTEIFYLGGTFWAAACICSADPPENSLSETPAESDIPKPENSAPC